MDISRLRSTRKSPTRWADRFGVDSLSDRQFFDWLTAGGGRDLARLIESLEREEIPWCAIDGLAVNYWAQNLLLSADADLVVAHERLTDALQILIAAGFQTCRDVRTIRVSGTSQLAIWIHTHEGYGRLPSRATATEVNGMALRVASLEDTLAAKIAIWSDPERRPIQRQKDLLDIMRLVEAHPELGNAPPPEILAQMYERGWRAERYEAQ